MTQANQKSIKREGWLDIPVSKVTFQQLSKKCSRINIHPKHLIFLILLISVFSEIFIDELGLPSYIVYINDLAMCLLIVWMFVDCLYHKGFRIDKGISTFILIFVLITAISTILNYTSILLTLWGYRTLLRGIVFFLAAVVYISPRDLLKIYNVAFYVQILNFVLALYQYFILGLYQDRLGGIFGHGNGALLNPFHAILVAFYLSRYLFKKKGIFRLLFIIITSLIIAALAEEKAYFVYLIVVVFVVVFLYKPSLKSIALVLLCGVTLYLTMVLMGSVNEGFGLDFISNPQGMIDYANNAYGISRLDPYSYINERFFKDDWLKYLFGYGVGNCNYSGTFAFFTSSFYRLYNSVNYMWFTHSFVLLETGYLGLISFASIFLYLLIYAFRRRKEAGYVANFEIAITLVVLLSIMFASSLIMNGAYFIYFALASIYVVQKQINPRRCKR